MTTPGGVPNLPAGALTEETLAEKLQDMSAAAMRSRARERMPSIFDDSTGGNILSDLTPFGLLTRIWAEVNSLIANADPADIQGPQDIPQLLLDFIQGLPVIGELVGLLEAILGEYAGDDEVLLAIQQIFAPIRKLVQLVAGQDVGFPTIEDVTSGWTALADALENVPGLGQIVGLVRSFGAALLGAVPVGIITDDTPSMLVEGGFDAAETIHPDSVFEWRAEGVPGTSPLGSAWVDANGSDLSDATEIMPVGADWELEIGTHVKWVSLAATAGQNAIRLNVLPYVDSQTPHPSGAVMVASVESPSGDSSSDKDGWVEIVGTWSPPEGVTHFAIEKHVTSAATAGAVGFDDTYVKATQKLPQRYTRDLPEDLMSLWNGLGSLVDQILIRLGITPVGSLLDRIFDLSDELEWIQEKAAEGASDAAAALNNIGELAYNLATNPASVLGPISQSMVTGLQSALTGLQTDIGSAVGDISRAIFAGWRGTTSGSTGTVAEVQQTIEVIAKAVYGDFTVETITSNQNWTRPFDTDQCLEFWAICIGGGGRGEAGQAIRTPTETSEMAYGGRGGRSGGYNAVSINPDDLPASVPCVIGTAAATAGADGGTTSFGAFASSVPGVGSISQGVSFIGAASKPGDGGKGGDAFISRPGSGVNVAAGYSADSGESSALAAGGIGGSGSGGTGGAGQSADMNGPHKSGGGGGGGGGGRAVSSGTANGGTGGNGGYPGGASGGGGAAAGISGIGGGANPGQPGTPANGVLFLAYKLEA